MGGHGPPARRAYWSESDPPYSLSRVVFLVNILAHRRSRNAGEDQALVIPRGDLLYWKIID